MIQTFSPCWGGVPHLCAKRTCPHKTATLSRKLPLQELLQRELKAMGILDEGRRAAGGGTEPTAGGGGGGAVVDVSAARTQTEAQDIIAQALMKQGMTNGSKEFQEAMTKAWRDNNIAKLPIK